MLNLNQSSIHQANNASMYDAGSALAREAESVHAEGVKKMLAPFEDVNLNERQQAILADRLEQWRELVAKAYNDIISKRAAWMPWTVCGPARYNGAKNSARADRQMEAAAEWNGKMDRFIENTVDAIRDAIPLDQMLAEFRSGQRREAISGDDPHALEKLNARLEGMQERHERMKARNAYYRKNGTLKGCPGISDADAEAADRSIQENPPMWQMPYPHFSLANSNAEMKRLRDRIETIQRHQETGDGCQEYDGFTVEISGTEGRINITFDDKPADPARDLLKKSGFHWSPRAKVWTRKLTGNASRVLRHCLIPGLLALDEYGEQPSQDPAVTLDEFAEEYV